MKDTCPVTRWSGSNQIIVHEWRVADYDKLRDKVDITFYCVWCRKIVMESKKRYD